MKELADSIEGPTAKLIRTDISPFERPGIAEGGDSSWSTQLSKWYVRARRQVIYTLLSSFSFLSCLKVANHVELQFHDPVHHAVRHVRLPARSSQVAAFGLRSQHSLGDVDPG